MGPFALESRVDGLSFQVSSRLDPRFWFRLVRRDDGDLISDFLLGSFVAGQAGPLLVECYRLLTLTPHPPLIFGDVLAGSKVDASAVEAAEARFIGAGSALLQAFDLVPTETRIEERDGKVDLVIEARPSA